MTDDVRGLFISFEGIDGCGKTTQLGLVATWLRDAGFEAHETREPGGTPGGARIRNLLLHGDPLLPRTELFLFAADRAEHVERILRPQLSAGHIVLSDRYADATVAFQGYGRGLDLALIDGLVDLATGGLRPDLTLVYDLHADVAMERILARTSSDAGSESRFDRESLAFHRRVREGYLEIARRDPERVRLVDADGTVDAVARRTRAILDPVIESWRTRR